MTFRFCLMGASQHPLVEVKVASLADLHDLMDRTRFVAGHLAEADEHGVQPGVLIATSRVQMVVEVD